MKYSTQTFQYLSELRDRVSRWAASQPRGKHSDSREWAKNLSLPQAVKAGGLNPRAWAGQLELRRVSDQARRTCALGAGAVLALGAVVAGTANESQRAVALERTAVVSELSAPADQPAPADAAPENSEGSAVPVVEAAAEPVEEAPSVPLDNLRVTSPFGWRENPLLGNGALEWHTGIDFGAPLGTPVKSTAPGTVVYAEYHQYGGLRVVVDHGDGVQTTYNHLNEIFVEVGQQVDLNEVVGAVGSTGNSTGPHLHYEVLLNGEYQDPAVWLGL